MDQSAVLLLDALSCALRGERVSWQPGTVASWADLRRLAAAHHVLPLIAQAVWDCPAAASDPAAVASLCAGAKQQVTVQAQHSADFLLLYRQLRQRGLSPLVVKGLICRALYPCPEQRPSVDEDLLVRPEEFMACHEALLSLGFQLLEKASSLQNASEVSYFHPLRSLYLEVHKSLFPPESEAYGDFNALFENAVEQAVPFPWLDTTFYTLDPTDHLLFLICHAHKHLLHSGVGIRQICDIGMFAAHFGEQIDWPRVFSGCASFRIEYVAAAMFRIAERWLALPMPPAFALPELDEAPLLEDILSAGLYGADDEKRLHSGTITLDAVAAERHGRQRRGLLATLFPSAGSLATRYPYLRKRPWLLPAAWLQRVVGYLQNGRAGAGESLRIGEQRIDLLRQYHVID